MQSSGQGLTFTDHDVKQCQIVIGLLSRAMFKGMEANSIMEAAPAFKWVEGMLQGIKDNVYDMSTARVIEAPPDPKAKAKPSRKAKA